MTTSSIYDAQGPRGRRIIRYWTAGVLIVVALIGAYVIYRLALYGQFEAKRWAVLLNPEFQMFLFTGWLGTMTAAAIALPLALTLGGLLAFARLSRSAVLRTGSKVFIDVMRGLPPLLLVFFIYLGAPAVGISLSPLWSLVFGVTLYNGSMLGEILRGGVLSLPAGQSEAATALGMSRTQGLRYVLLPPAVRMVLPLIVLQVIMIVKESSLGFIIGYIELTRNATGAISFLGPQYAIPIYTLLAAIYISMNFSLSLLGKRLGRTRVRTTMQMTAAA